MHHVHQRRVPYLSLSLSPSLSLCLPGPDVRTHACARGPAGLCRVLRFSNGELRPNGSAAQSGTARIDFPPKQHGLKQRVLTTYHSSQIWWTPHFMQLRHRHARGCRYTHSRTTHDMANCLQLRPPTRKGFCNRTCTTNSDYK